MHKRGPQKQSTDKALRHCWEYICNSPVQTGEHALNLRRKNKKNKTNKLYDTWSRISLRLHEPAKDFRTETIAVYEIDNYAADIYAL